MASDSGSTSPSFDSTVAIYTEHSFGSPSELTSSPFSTSMRAASPWGPLEQATSGYAGVGLSDPGELAFVTERDADLGEAEALGWVDGGIVDDNYDDDYDDGDDDYDGSGDRSSDSVRLPPLPPLSPMLRNLADPGWTAQGPLQLHRRRQRPLPLLSPRPTPPPRRQMSFLEESQSPTQQMLEEREALWERRVQQERARQQQQRQQDEQRENEIALLRAPLEELDANRRWHQQALEQERREQQEQNQLQHTTNVTFDLERQQELHREGERHSRRCFGLRIKLEWIKRALHVLNFLNSILTIVLIVLLAKYHHSILHLQERS